MAAGVPGALALASSSRYVRSGSSSAAAVAAAAAAAAANAATASVPAMVIL